MSDGNRQSLVPLAPWATMMVVAALIAVLPATHGCRPASASKPTSTASRFDHDADVQVRLHSWRWVDDLPREIAQFESVFWDPRDTESLRRWLSVHKDQVSGARVLEIGVGTGLLSLCCLQHGAKEVVGTDINPAALANAAHNAELLGFQDRLDLRLTPVNDPRAFPAIRPNEQFDLILSNPPWEDATAETPADYAYFDAGFLLLDSLLADLRNHLKPGGKALLAYGARPAIAHLQRLADRRQLRVTQLDDRKLESLEDNFLPGMLLLVEPKP